MGFDALILLFKFLFGFCLFCLHHSCRLLDFDLGGQNYFPFLLLWFKSIICPEFFVISFFYFAFVGEFFCCKCLQHYFLEYIAWVDYIIAESLLLSPLFI